VSTTKVKTTIATLKKPQLQPGDLVTVARPKQIAFGRVFDVGQDTARVWWSGRHDLPAVEGLVTHQMADIAFVERPAQYVAVLFEHADGGRYGFVSAGADVTLEERAFELAGNYTIISRRTAKSAAAMDTTALEETYDDQDFYDK
jgi:hypothetical protein